MGHTRCKASRRSLVRCGRWSVRVSRSSERRPQSRKLPVRAYRGVRAACDRWFPTGTRTIFGSPSSLPSISGTCAMTRCSRCGRGCSMTKVGDVDWDADRMRTCSQELPVRQAGGEPACLAHVVCPACGAVLDGGPHRIGCTSEG